MISNVALLTATLVASEASALLNLRNHHLLSTEEKITPFESIAFIATFDEVPVFGGEELRAKMLAQANKTKQQIFGLEVDPLELTNSFQQGFQKVSKSVHSHVQSLTNLVIRSQERQAPSLENS